MPLDWLDSRHPIYDVHHEEWARRERLLRGGPDVIASELARFEWETEEGDSYRQRKKEAVYPGFGDAFLRTLIGHVLKDRPEPGAGLEMGAMGEIQRADDQPEPSQAELVYFNVNGTGGDGMQWWQWVAAVFQRAGATGLRWVLVEAPPWDPATQGRAPENVDDLQPVERDGAVVPISRNPTVADVLRGQRPYAVEFSPRTVTNWQIEKGTLQWCIIRPTTDTRRVGADGRMTGSAAERGYYLLVRAGCKALGPEFQRGGWWMFDAEKQETARGTWAKTGGEIPMALAVWEWEDLGATSEAPADQGGAIPSGAGAAAETALPMARSATTALDNLSVAYMNAVSAWRSNMWRSAGGPTMLLGVDTESWSIAVAQWKSGASLMGVPASDGGKGTSPTVAHSGAAAVDAAAYQALLEHMTAEAERMMVQEATSAPDSSGKSKEAGFTESKAPRLTMLAENIESFCNTILRFFELRFGHRQPWASVQMPKQFDLAPVEEDIAEFFDTFRQTNLRSATLETKAVVRLAEAKGLVTDDDRETITAELKDSATAEATAVAQARAAQQEIRDALQTGRGRQQETPAPAVA